MLLHIEMKSQVTTNRKSEPIDVDLFPAIAKNVKASKPWVKELNLFERDNNIYYQK